MTVLSGGQRTLGAAVDAFLAQPRPATTARTYTRTLEHLARQLGRDRPLASVSDDELAAAASALVELPVPELAVGLLVPGGRGWVARALSAVRDACASGRPPRPAAPGPRARHPRGAVPRPAGR